MVVAVIGTPQRLPAVRERFSDSWSAATMAGRHKPATHVAALLNPCQRPSSRLLSAPWDRSPLLRCALSDARFGTGGRSRLASVSGSVVVLIVAAVVFLVLDRIGHRVLIRSTRSGREEAIVSTSQNSGAFVGHHQRRPAPANQRQRAA